MCICSVQCAVKGSTAYPRRSCCIETKWMAFRLLQYIFNNIWSIKWLVRSLPWKVSPHLAQLGGGSWPGWAQAGQVGVQNAIFGYVRLAQVLSLKQEKIQTTFICTWVWEAKGFPNIWGVGVIVFLLKLSELGSDRSQDDAVCPRRLFIFLNQGNISKILPASVGEVGWLGAVWTRSGILKKKKL